ncbi:DNA-binding XRE family transcriptional regulator [Leucobacter exalbidus]|uniref:DNA-binding XRE family transcriptional regulator n=1 Tax=Leucobacter exalbidus TaxID=662960 RepID=A0A940T4G9_9MICO|nr:helix-turn-helix domain-containing protein [Leucobacter exalbidus]MBP1324946.1 DNA-binding XRE family transcriptional regulator [Leucobacter exalbidus]
MEQRPFIHSVARLARVMKEARAEAGITQEQLAAKANIPLDYIVDVEAGRPRAEVGRAVIALKALGLNPRAVPATHPDAFAADGTLRPEYVQHA